MRIKTYILITVVLALFVVLIDVQAKEESALSREYKIKAAFLYNFIKFVDWPEEKVSDSNEPIIIGIIGSEKFIDVLKSIDGKQVGNKNVVVKYFKGFEESKKSEQEKDSEWSQKIKSLGKCHVVMFCTYELTKIKNPGKITEALTGASVLTVGERPGFLEAGGMINFIMEDKKVRFEINLDAADKANLKIRSKLLRLAKRVISEKGTEDEHDG